MKKVISLLSLAVSAYIVCGSASAQGVKCSHGLSWVISQNQNWGLGRPVVTKVLPYSSASEAGLKNGDIIERIDGFDTSNLSSQQVIDLLQSSARLHTLQTSNIGSWHKKHILSFHCQTEDGLAERELAELFSLYSTEDASIEYITYPYSYTSSPSYSLASLRTYTIIRSNAGQNGELDEANTILAGVLDKKGLKASPNGDVLASLEFSFQALNSNSIEDNVNGLTWRYDYNAKELRPFPIYGQKHKGVESAKFLSVLTLRLRDARTKEVVWSCEARDYLSEEMSLVEYAESAIPSMFEGFPLMMQQYAPQLAVRTLRYNYTGIIYNKFKLNQIIDIDDASPAMKAGLRPGDTILSINGLPLNKPNINELLATYFKTAERLDRYRDKELPALKSLVGNLNVPYFKVGSYDAISSVLSQSKSDACFTYLFSFRPYIQREQTKSIIYEIQRGKDVYYVLIQPEYRDESTISPY